MAPGVADSDVSFRTQTYNESPSKVYAILLLLCFGYFGKYFCTSNMYEVQTLYQKKEGITDVELSTMFAFGYLASMFGKIAAGIMSDTRGGKFVMCLSSSGFVILTLIFSLVPEGGGFYPYLAVWTANGFFALGLAWVSVVAVATNWIPLKYMGRLMGLVSMAPQLGDAVARFTLSYFIGYGWKAVFQIAAIIAFCLQLPVFFFVTNAPGEATIQKAKEIDTSQQKASGKPKPSFMAKMKPLLSQPLLWLLCFVSGSLYGTRSIFLLYAVTFLANVHCQSVGDFTPECLQAPDTAAMTGRASTIYTILGCVSVFAVGYAKDALPKKHRASILFTPIVFLFLAMAYLGVKGTDVSYETAVFIVGLTGLCLFGPYKVLGGAFAVDIGGKELKATACSLMGIFDNLFAMIMLFVKGSLGNDWITNFRIMAGLSLIAGGCSMAVWFKDLGASKPKTAPVPVPVPEIKAPLLPPQAEVFERRQRAPSEEFDRRDQFRESRTEQ